MEERINGGYIIIKSVTVGNTEFVLGENRKAPDPYVTWECTNGTNYCVCSIPSMRPRC